MDDSDLDSVKDKPDFKDILRAVLRHQLKYLVHQLSKYGDEETLVLTTNVLDGVFSHQGSVCTQGFMHARDDIKGQFMVHCMKNSYRQLKDQHAALSMNSSSVLTPNISPSIEQPITLEGQSDLNKPELDVKPVSTETVIQTDAKQQSAEAGGHSFNSDTMPQGLGAWHLPVKHTSSGLYGNKIHNSNIERKSTLKQRAGAKRPCEFKTSKQSAKRKAGKNETNGTSDKSVVDTDDDNIVVKIERLDGESIDSELQELLNEQEDSTDDKSSASLDDDKSVDSLTKLKQSLDDDAYLQQFVTGPFNRKSYSCEYKLEAVKYAEVHGAPNAQKLFKLSESTLRGWKKEKEKLMSFNEINSNMRRNCRMRGSQWPELEKQLASLIEERFKNGKIVNQRIMMAVAKNIAESMGLNDFTASLGWLQRFKDRHGIRLKDNKKLDQNTKS